MRASSLKFLQLFLVFIALATLGACSSTDEGVTDEQASGMTGEGVTGQGPLSEIYDGAGSAQPGTQGDFAVNVGDRVFFGYDRFDLSPEARATLEKQAQWINQYSGLTLTVEGHADERGTREYNLALGERRANSVKNYLVALGVDAGRIETISYGKERPAVPGSDESAWAQNRRGVTKIN
jgi:peptidoglycan-associated lipoprotein